MEGSNLMYVPYRATTEIPIGAILKETISNEFYQSAALFEDDLNGLTELRQKIFNLIESDSADISHGVPILKEYYCQLCYIERKFPRDSITFTWFSNNLTYQPNNKISLKSFEFEKLNILYNLAALYSKHAFTQDRSDLEGLKMASLHFQNAAGIFQIIIDLISDIKEFQVPLEYSVEAMTGLQYLLLGQAQEAYWQRALSSSSDKIVAILSQQVGAFYKSSYESFNKSQFILRSQFLNHINCKSCHFLAATHYRMAQHEYLSSNYGEQVAHLKELFALCAKGSKSLKGVSEVVVNDLKGLEDTIKNMLKTAEKENDLIYHKDVPKNATPVMGRLMVKSMVFDDLLNPITTLKQNYHKKLFFENLLPYIVIQSAQAFKERQDEFVMSNLINPLNTLTKILKNCISERSLPLSLDSITKPQRLPDNLLQHCQDLLSNDAISKLQKSLNELTKLSVESQQLIDGCRERILIESQEDDVMKERQGTKRWNRVSSKEASRGLVDKINHYEQYLSQAADGDDTIRQNVQEIKPYLEMMTNLAVPGQYGKLKLMKFIPMSDLMKLSPELNQVIKQLKDVLSVAANEINKRQQFIDAVELKSRELAILPRIISEYRLLQSNDNVIITEETFEPFFKNHLQKFDTDLKNLYQIRDKQTKLENEIDLLNKKFLQASSETQEVSSARKEALQTLEDAFNGYKENLDNISDGLKFYRDFILNVSTLLQKCDEFVYERRMEARDLEKKLNDSPQRLRAPQLETPSRPTVIHPPLSISQQRFKTSFSDDEDSFHTDIENDSSFDRDALFVRDERSKSPLKLKRGNDGERIGTRVEDDSPLRHRKIVDKSGFWDPKNGIQFE